ncbi:Glutathione S-transferase TCHQD [Glycine soja]|uniref:Glutathione S-transferase TCHQD isoform F n=1 Tax=Glycine soja TaxID=3848 RepID=A0A445H664_GLYSO|nr:Glutathione S-transferase TCHQD isoform F [Glycine soja]RZB69067.1 Glutathione S-transferase TCHQD isoform G [Glycine soja]
MQLYHHPLDLESQRVRLALEEEGVDYTSHHVNPITAKNLDSTFFKMNRHGRVPVFQNGSHIIYNTIDIIQESKNLDIAAEIAVVDPCFENLIIEWYIERIAVVSSGAESISASSREVIEWMQKIQDWDPKIFTLSHIPEKYRLYVSKFIRQVAIARMSESPELASDYHRKLKEAYETEEKLKEADVLRRSKDHLVRLLDEVERQLSETPHLAGQEFTMADVMLVPVLARLELLDLENEYIIGRPNIAEYWILVQQRLSYKKVIGKYFNGWRKHRTLLKAWFLVRIRSLLKRGRDACQSGQAAKDFVAEY